MKVTGAPVLHLRVGASSVHADMIRGPTPIWAADAAYRSCAELAEVVAHLAAAPPARCRRLEVTLERPPAQMRALTDLPPVRDRDLATLVANQAGRFFRRNGAPLVTDAVWVTNGKARVAQAAAVEEPLLVAILDGARQAGLMVRQIRAAGMAPRLQLWPSAERAARERARRRTTMRLAITVLALWIVAGALFGVRVILERRAIEIELAAAEAPMAALREVRHEMRSAEATVLELASARRARGQALATLARVNAGLPDSSVLTSYFWRSDRSGFLAGAARRAADVVADLERSHAVARPRLEGAVLRETLAGRDWERFTIMFGGNQP